MEPYMRVAVLSSSGQDRYGSIRAPKGTPEDDLRHSLMALLPEGWGVGRLVRNLSDDESIPEELILYVTRPPPQKIEVTFVLGKEVGS